ncbi:isopenicillin N synthase family dioxygenase [Actinocrispum wychmicini]|uniref:Isopenicillin N synthase-like dioxygenase n=1 Tax=Actinocrispum wychmicini TaxID=1213861 RepID=A0A4V2S804_9PSEU|nr:2OG-Fe(II) oxygenase family protein [Actinocrispum wychmicini]TCO61930.1 isopenicillin N synthase-like dioxygenase [Actinocrispum wychmicini]
MLEFMNSVGDLIDTIDLTGWRSNADEKIARQLVDSFQRIGFAYVTGHGVPDETVERAFDASRQFFHQDPAQLDTVHYRHANKYHGFVPRGATPGIGSFHEMYDLGLDIPTTYRGPGAVMRTTPNLWPENLPMFRPAVERYQGAMRDLADSILAALAVGLGLPADFFRIRCAEPHAQMRLLHYLPFAADSADRFSVGRHCDYETVTILAQDDVGGLQVSGPDGQWINVPPLDGTFVLNAGDMLTRWTNGLLPATPHRVLSPTDTERFSVAFFYATSYDVVVEPALPPADPDGPQYEPITTGAYMWQRFTEEGI